LDPKGRRMDHGENCMMMCDLACILHLILSGRMRWVGHVAHMGEGRNVYGVLVGKPKGKRPYEDLGVGGRIMLRWTLGR
jgi:hypothetical protein